MHPLSNLKQNKKCDGNEIYLEILHNPDGLGLEIFGYITSFDGDVNKYAYYWNTYAFKDAKPTLWEMIKELEERGFVLRPYKG